MPDFFRLVKGKINARTHKMTFLLAFKGLLVYTFSMQQGQTIFVDCDGVLYDASYITYEEMITACQRAGQELGIQWDEAPTVHADLKAKGIHGWYNTVLVLCQRFHVEFEQVAQRMVKYVDYTKIPEDLELLNLLQQVSHTKNLVLFTNNTRIHVDKVFHRLFRQTLAQTHLAAITAEDTLRDGYFHLKQQPDAFGVWCQKFHTTPAQSLLLDDTANVIESAQSQGLQTIQTLGPEMTKKVLKGLL